MPKVIETSPEKAVIGEYLEGVRNDKGWQISCRKCGHSFCDGAKNPKEFAVVREEPLSEAGTLYVDSPRFVLRHFFCPGCGTLFALDIAEVGSPVLWESQIDRIGS